MKPKFNPTLVSTQILLLLLGFFLALASIAVKAESTSGGVEIESAENEIETNRNDEEITSTGVGEEVESTRSDGEDESTLNAQNVEEAESSLNEDESSPARKEDEIEYVIAKSKASNFSYFEFTIGRSDHEDAYLDPYDGYLARLKYGWQLHKYFALELNYNHFNISGEENDEILESNSINAIGLGLKGVLPFSRDGTGSSIYLEISPVFYSYEEQHMLLVVDVADVADLSFLDLQSLIDTLVSGQVETQTTSTSGFAPFANVAFGYKYTARSGWYFGLEVSYFSIDPDIEIDLILNRARTSAIRTTIDDHEVVTSAITLGYRW